MISYILSRRLEQLEEENVEVDQLPLDSCPGSHHRSPEEEDEVTILPASQQILQKLAEAESMLTRDGATYEAISPPL